ncbi:MAG: S8 family peptidase [Bacteroidales bacterium]|jgi:subtilisin family serine protease|nr:S8 family peptidase [Bacteroidales bacterium]
MKIKSLLLIAFFLTLTLEVTYTQVINNTEYNQSYFYRIWFTDKGSVTVSDFSPEELLSPEAIERREKCGIDPLTTSDLPVNKAYLNTIAGTGLTFHCSSRWMNTALFSSPSEINPADIEEMPFVRDVTVVKQPVEPSKRKIDKYGTISAPNDLSTFNPLVPLNGVPLHQSGFTGKNLIIAVLDAGFVNADRVESLTPMRNRGGVIATWDFVTGNSNVYGYHGHGTAVLTILAGDLPDIISGSAPGADYLLLRTEDDESEFPVEQDFWAAAAEYADSAGADIISSSLGYYMFDDPTMDYAFSDMNGNTAFVTLAADAAASKGILVVASAGNERNKEWVRIIAPSDGDSVMSVGALRQDLTISDFSSAGFSADNRVKPDVVAPGVNLPLQYEPGKWQTGSGTSFSCPVVSGLCASLMQAVPGATAAEVAAAVRKSSDRYNNPDSLYGYGIPDFIAALKSLEDIHTYKPEVSITAGPNPFFDEINLWFRETPEYLSVTVTNGSGRTVLRREFTLFTARSFKVNGFEGMAEGLFYLKVNTGKGEKVFKMIRLKR